VRALTEWRKGFHIAGKVIASSTTIAVPYVRGVLNFGDPMILLVRRPHSQWYALTGAPPVIHAWGDTLVAIINPGDAQPHLGLYRPVEGR
jgi:hypothetical protein